MKACLEFNLPEDRVEYELASKAGDMHSALYEFAVWLRARMKYENGPDVNLEELAVVSEEFWSILNELGVDPYRE